MLGHRRIVVDGQAMVNENAPPDLSTERGVATVRA
jgi:hypothetical protein